MDINYKILWFEDTDESFETLSRRTERYVNSRNLRCKIDRVWGESDFDLASLDLNSYDILVVDLRLSEGSKGFEIIKEIRNGSFVNDVLFYSGEGIDALDSIMREHRLEGVFISDRNNKAFLPKIKQLIDKSIRRSENVISIRGVVMDATSEFDTQMQEITAAACPLLTADETARLKNYITENLLASKVSDTTAMANKYPQDGEWDILEVLSENDFNSMMRAKLLNYIFNLKSNHKIQSAISCCKDSLPQAFSKTKSIFVSAYDNEILKFRNKLAHVKNLNATTPVFIGKINGVDYYCDESFCSSIRASLIRYNDWFSFLYDRITE